MPIVEKEVIVLVDLIEPEREELVVDWARDLGNTPPRTPPRRLRLPIFGVPNFLPNPNRLEDDGVDGRSYSSLSASVARSANMPISCSGLSGYVMVLGGAGGGAFALEGVLGTLSVEDFLAFWRPSHPTLAFGLACTAVAWSKYARSSNSPRSSMLLLLLA